MNGDLFITSELLAALAECGRSRTAIARTLAPTLGCSVSSIQKVLVAGRRVAHNDGHTIVDATGALLDFPSSKALTSMAPGSVPEPQPDPPALVPEPKPQLPVVLAIEQPQPESPTPAVAKPSPPAQPPPVVTSPTPRRLREGEFDRAAQDAQVAIDRKRNVRGSVERRFQEARAAIRAQRWRLTDEDIYASRSRSPFGIPDEEAA